MKFSLFAALLGFVASNDEPNGVCSGKVCGCAKDSTCSECFCVPIGFLVSKHCVDVEHNPDVSAIINKCNGKMFDFDFYPNTDCSGNPAMSISGKTGECTSLLGGLTFIKYEPTSLDDDNKFLTDEIQTFYDLLTQH